MAYIGSVPLVGNYSKVDDVSSGFNSSNDTFNLTVSGHPVYPFRPEAVVVSLGGVLQEPTTSYTISGSTITFTTPPAASTGFFAIVLGNTVDIGTPSDGSVTTAKLASITGSDTNVVTGTAGTSGDLVQWDANGDAVDGPTPPTGTIVGTSDTQTLTNKTLTTPTIGDFTNAAHTHADAANGGSVADINLATNVTGVLPSANGGTGQDLSAATGAIVISSGTVSAGTVSTTYGGTGQDFSASSGIVQLSAGTASVVAAPTGDIVGTSDTQTLTNKTLTTPTISDYTNATHTHAGTSTGGAVQSASDSVAGVTELATVAELETGTDTSRTITPDVFAGSNFGERAVEVLVFAPDADVATGDGKAYFVIPSSLTGMDLVEVHAAVYTAGTTGTTDVQIRNVTDSVDMLTTKLTIDSTETGSDTAATPAVIDTANDDVASFDRIAIDVDAKSTTAPKGLIVTLIFRLP